MKKRKVIFRIREELNETLKQIQFIPEAKGYVNDITYNSINGDCICLTENVAQTAIDRTKTMIKNYGQNIFILENLNETQNSTLNIDDVSKRYFIIRRYHSGTSADKTDIIGLTTDEKYAKSRQSVFCDYEEVKMIQ